MTGDRRIDQAALFYEFCRDRQQPADHKLRSIDRFVDLAGVGNASTFQMIPAIWRETAARTGGPGQADREAAAVIGFTSAIAAFGALFIPKAYGASIAGAGSANPALWGFLLFSLSCAVLTSRSMCGPAV